MTHRLTFIVTLFAAAASAGGLLVPGLYRDPNLIRTAWLANDAVTLVVALMLLAAAYFEKSGSFRARMWRLGLLLYMLYNYAFYLFGAQFNWFFPLYAALFTLSTHTLILSLLEIVKDNNTLPKAPSNRWVAVFLLLVALPLGTIEITEWLRFITLNRQPSIPTLVLALDLAIVVPNTLLAAVLLWKHHPWGLILGAMMLIKAFTYGMVLISGTILIGITGVGKWDPLLPFYVFFCFGGFVFLKILLAGTTPARVL